MIAVKEKLWSGEFLGLGIASCLLYITQYVLIATLPIVITKLYGGSDFDAGMAMTYFQIGTISCRILQDPLWTPLINGGSYGQVPFSFSWLWRLLILRSRLVLFFIALFTWANICY